MRCIVVAIYRYSMKQSTIYFIIDVLRKDCEVGDGDGERVRGGCICSS